MGETRHNGAGAGPGQVTLGGRAYLVGPATIADVTAIRNRLRRAMPRPLDALSELMASAVWPKLSEAARLEMEREALAAHRAGGFPLTDDLAGQMLEQPDHCAFVFWLLARKHAPALTLEDVRKDVAEDGTAALLLDLCRESGLEELAPNGGGRSG